MLGWGIPFSAEVTRMTFSQRASAGLAVLLLMRPGPAVAEERPRARAPVFGTGISLVQLPVFVIDREGHAARGLTAADFEVEDDGRRTEVVSFRYVDTTSIEEQAEIPLSPAARRRFLILFDMSFTNLAGLNRAQRAAADFVRRRLNPSDLAAVATFDVHNGMRLIANFTEDRALLVHAVDTLGMPKLTRINDPLGLAADFAVTDLTRPQSGAEEPTPQALLNNVLAVFIRQMRSAEEQAYRNHIATLLSGFEDLARALRGVEGRKQVLYFWVFAELSG